MLDDLGTRNTIGGLQGLVKKGLVARQAAQEKAKNPDAI